MDSVYRLVLDELFAQPNDIFADYVEFCTMIDEDGDETVLDDYDDIKRIRDLRSLGELRDYEIKWTFDKLMIAGLMVWINHHSAAIFGEKPKALPSL